MDDPGGTQNRKSADYPKSRVPGLLRKRLTIGNGNFNLHIASALLFYDLTHHLARNRIDGGLTYRNGKPRFGYGANARPCFERNALARHPYRGNHRAAVGHIRIVARVLDDTRLRPTLTLAFQG